MVIRMKKDNAMSLVSYIFVNISWGCFAFYLFSRLLLSRIRLPFSGTVLSTYQSRCFFVASCSLLMIASLMVTAATHRNRANLFMNIMISMGLTCALLSFRSRPVLTILIFALWLALSAFCVLRMLLWKIPDGRDVVKTIERRLWGALHISRGLLSFAALFCLIILCFGSLFGTGSAITSGVRPDSSVAHTDSSLIKTNFDSLKQIREPSWSQLTAEERLDVAQHVVNIEATILGLPASPKVVADVLPLGTIGYYSHETKSIAICIDQLGSDPAIFLDILLHEVFHCYQHYLCDAYENMDESYRDLQLFLLIAEYEDNFANYYSSGASYISQIVEITANAYANRYTGVYFEIIDELLQDEL